MNDAEFERLIDEHPYQVLLFTTALSFPINFASHPWFITVNNGSINRWEVWQNASCCESSWDHLHRNLFRPLEGMRPIPRKNSKRRKGKLRGRIRGNSNSMAYEMVKFIENEIHTYPSTGHYRFFPGPNSNTFAQWVIDQFPESELKLPLSCIGRRFDPEKRSFRREPLLEK